MQQGTENRTQAKTGNTPGSREDNMIRPVPKIETNDIVRYEIGGICGPNVYVNGRKVCMRCRVSLLHDGKRCPICKITKLRTRPRNGKYKERFVEHLRY